MDKFQKVTGTDPGHGRLKQGRDPAFLLWLPDSSRRMPHENPLLALTAIIFTEGSPFIDLVKII